MTKAEMQSIVNAYLAEQLNCSENDLIKEATTCVRSNSKDPFLKILISGKAVIVSASEGIYDKICELLQGKSKDEIFECPLVYGQTIHFIPELKYVKEPVLPSEYTYALLEGNEIYGLSDIKGFDNSLVFDENGSTTTEIVLAAYKGNSVVAMAGAEIITDKLWEVGVDVMPAYRQSGLATALVQKLTFEIIKREVVPFYSSSITNIASQMVANRAGYIPYWVDSWGNVFDSFYPYDRTLDLSDYKTDN